MTDYCTLTEVRQYGKFKAEDTANDGLLDDLIGRVSQLMDSHCGRQIVPAIDATHYFGLEDIADYETDTIRLNDLVLDETLVSITSLTNGDGVVITAGDYFLLPRAYERKSYIRIKEAATIDWSFDTDGYIQVVGKWGYTLTTPEDIKQACIETVLYTFHKAGENHMTVDRTAVSPDGVRYLPVAWTQFAKETLAHYRKKV